MKRSLVALAALTIAAPAFAADLNGSCCTDLEERVAEIEATMAKKGTRKVSLTISGQINKALLWDSASDDVVVFENDNSPSVFRMVGEAKVSPSLSAGFIYEFGVSDEIKLRHAAVWLGTQVGKLWIGQTSSATDGIVEISVANTAVASRMMYGMPFDGNRLELVKYETPTIGGFVASAAYAPNASVTGQDVWDVALRYSGELAGLRMAAGVGYRHEENVVALVTPGVVGYVWGIPFLPVMTGTPYIHSGDNIRVLAGSASIKHMASGLFANLAAARELESGVTMGQLQAGIERNFFGFGATTLFAEYGRIDFNPANADFYGVGIVQSIDGLSADLYATFRVLDDDVKAGMAGMRIRF